MALSPEAREELCQVAKDAAKFAYAPYSKFLVGAAVLGEKEIYWGTNVENASYGLALCAERVALANAIAKGEQEFRAIAVACLDAKSPQDINSIIPCGACRQWIAELAAEAEIIVCGERQNYVFTLEELLPISFRLTRKGI